MLRLSSSSSPLTSLYASPDFKVARDNDLPSRVAMNVVHLRRYRDCSQSSLAKIVRTSQSKIARIEGGDENITLNTLRRLAAALGGRIRFALEPAEVAFLSLPEWWDSLESGVKAPATWTRRVGAVQQNQAGEPTRAAFLWTSESTIQLRDINTGEA